MSQEQSKTPSREERDDIQAALSASAPPPLQGGGKGEVDFDDLPEPLPELDEGPPPEPVDDIQDALVEAAQEGAATELDFDELPPPSPPLERDGMKEEVDFDDLPEPLPELDEGPQPGPVDDIQGALIQAAQAGVRTEVDLDELPEPGLSGPQKVIRFKQRDTATKPTPRLSPSPEAVSWPGFAPAVAKTTEFWMLLTLFVSFRLLTLFLLRPGGYLRDWSDFDTYFGIAGLSDYGLYPFLNFWLEWPPLVPWLAVGAYRLSLLLAPWSDDPRLWFILILGGIFVLFEVGNFVLIYRLARRLFVAHDTVSRVLWLYVGLFPPVYAMLGFFDGLVLFFMLLALDLLLQERRLLSAVSVGVGFMVKIIPILILPVALRYLWHQYREKESEARVEVGLYIVVFGLTVAVLLAPFLIRGPQWVRASAQSILGRSSWETVWAVAEGYYGFGQVGGDRLKTLAEMNEAGESFAIHEGRLPWWLITLGFAGVYAYLFTRPADTSRPRPLLAFAGLTVAIFLLYTKGYSPQFLVYLLPFIVLLFPDSRGLTYALILTGLNVLEQPVYFVLLPQASWLLTFIVMARFVVTLLVALEFAAAIWPLEQRWPGLTTLQATVPQYLGGLALLALVILIPFLLRSYQAERLAGSPIAAFVNFIKVQTRNIENIQPGPLGKPRLLLSDQAAYRQLYPYLHNDFDLQLTDGAAKKYPGAPRVVDLLQGLDTIWVLPTGPQERVLSNAVSGRGQALATFDFEGLGMASLYGFQANIPPFIAPARFSSGIELLTHEVEVEAGAVNVTLYWRALNSQSQDYKVFTQLLDGQGQRVAGHDGVPANGADPTNGWPVGTVRADAHRIELPPDLPPGEYSLIAGLYNDFGDRLRAIAPNGYTFANQAVPLETIRLP
ncbi:MAG: DUF2029 domain-containing protein [Anaerolineales bacterium]|nr:DUF2029 domain-containing protein [Anaerolineales bacterium]